MCITFLRKYKKILITLLSLCIITTGGFFTLYTRETHYLMTLKPMHFDNRTSPDFSYGYGLIEFDNELFAPLGTFVTLGLIPKYSPEQQTVSIMINGINCIYKIGDKQSIIGNEVVMLPSAPRIVTFEKKSEIEIYTNNGGERATVENSSHVPYLPIKSIMYQTGWSIESSTAKLARSKKMFSRYLRRKFVNSENYVSKHYLVNPVMQSDGRVSVTPKEVYSFSSEDRKSYILWISFKVKNLTKQWLPTGQYAIYTQHASGKTANFLNMDENSHWPQALWLPPCNMPEDAYLQFQQSSRFTFPSTDPVVKVIYCDEISYFSWNVECVWKSKPKSIKK